MYPHIILQSYGECTFFLVLFIFFCLILTTIAYRLIVVLPPHAYIFPQVGECIYDVSPLTLPLLL